MRSATKKKIGKDKSYREFILAQPCCVCEVFMETQNHKTEGAHIGPRALSTKVQDRQMLPMCQLHHLSLHVAGPVLFWRAVGVDPDTFIKRFNERYDEGERPA